MREAECFTVWFTREKARRVNFDDVCQKISLKIVIKIPRYIVIIIP